MQEGPYLGFQGVQTGLKVAQVQEGDPWPRGEVDLGRSSQQIWIGDIQSIKNWFGHQGKRKEGLMKKEGRHWSFERKENNGAGSVGRARFVREEGE